MNESNIEQARRLATDYPHYRVPFQRIDVAQPMPKWVHTAMLWGNAVAGVVLLLALFGAGMAVMR